MSPVKDRKAEEQELHDHLRGDLALEPRYTSNKKFYCIAEANEAYVREWLQARGRGKKVLDYCCGNGEFTIWLAEQGAEAHGIDISPISIQNGTMASLQRGTRDQAIFHVMDAEGTTFPDGYFDLAVVHGVLHHLDLEKAYRELARILRPEGEAICTEALKHNLGIHLYRKLTPHLRSAWETEHILGRKEIEMAGQYFGSVRVSRFFHLARLMAIPFRNLPFFRSLERSLGALDSVLLKIPVIKWQAWMAVFVLAQPRK